MKKIKRTRTARRLAGALAVLLILGLVLFVDCFTGDPVNRAFANRQMLAWAERQWPGNDFYIAEQSGGSCFTYTVRLQSSVSPDTWFTMDSVLGLWGYQAGYEAQVKQGYNTRVRLEQALQGAAKAGLEQHAFLEKYDAQVYAALGPFDPKGRQQPPQGLELDLPYDPAFAQQASLALHILVSGPPDPAQARQAAADAKAALQASGLSFARYQVTLRDKAVDYQQAKDTLVEKTFTAQELR